MVSEIHNVLRRYMIKNRILMVYKTCIDIEILTLEYKKKYGI